MIDRQFAFHTWRGVLFAHAVLLFCSLLPRFIAFTAGWIAKSSGCELHEGYVNECVIAGYDAGGILYGAFLFGWLGIATVLGGGFLWLGISWDCCTSIRPSDPSSALHWNYLIVG